MFCLNFTYNYTVFIVLKRHILLRSWYIFLLAGSDYSLPNPFEVFYLAGSQIGTQKCVTIRNIDDDAFEGTHSFTVELIDPGNMFCNVVSPSTIQIDILDNEGQWMYVCLCV